MVNTKDKTPERKNQGRFSRPGTSLESDDPQNGEMISISSEKSKLEAPEKKEVLDAPQKKERLETAERKKMVERDQPNLLSKPEEQKIKELEDCLIRLSAEFDNFRKRTERESKMLKENANASMMLNLLEVLDEFDMAMDIQGPEDDFRSGMRMIHAKLNDVLKSEGLERMECVGMTFDPHLHEVVGFEEGPENEILNVVVNGCTFKGKVLRYAKVIIGKKD